MSGGPVHVVGAAIIRSGTCLAAQRSTVMSLPLKWEFPGGKVEPGETAEEALLREILEELGVEIEVGQFLARGTSTRGDRTFQLDVYLARALSDEVEVREHERVEWFDADALLALDWADADLPAARAASDWLRSNEGEKSWIPR